METLLQKGGRCSEGAGTQWVSYNRGANAGQGRWGTTTVAAFARMRVHRCPHSCECGYGTVQCRWGTAHVAGRCHAHEETTAGKLVPVGRRALGGRRAGPRAGGSGQV